MILETVKTIKKTLKISPTQPSKNSKVKMEAKIKTPVSKLSVSTINSNFKVKNCENSIRYGLTQFSSLIPAILSNSVVFCVTTIKLFTTAVQPISKSKSPIKVPFFLSLAFGRHIQKLN